MRRKEKLILCTTKTLGHWVGNNSRDTFSFVVNYEVFFISVMLRVGCNIVESSIVNCGIVSWLEKHKKR